MTVLIKEREIMKRFWISGITSFLGLCKPEKTRIEGVEHNKHGFSRLNGLRFENLE